MWRAVGISLLLSAGLAAFLMVWTNHTTAAAHSNSHAFAQNAKAICDHAPHSAAGLQRATTRLSQLDEPPNVHRAVARLDLHWRRMADLLRAGARPSSRAYRAELKQARLSADPLNIDACRRVAR